MSSTNPLDIVTPNYDPLAIVDPEEAPLEPEIDNPLRITSPSTSASASLGIVESIDIRLDDAFTNIQETIDKSYLNVQRAKNKQKTVEMLLADRERFPTEADAHAFLAEKEDNEANYLAGEPFTVDGKLIDPPDNIQLRQTMIDAVNRTDIDWSSPGEALSGIKYLMVLSGQHAMGSIRSIPHPVPKFIADVGEAAYSNILSAPLEQVGTFYADLTGTSQENNVLYQFGRTVREIVRTPDAALAEEGLGREFSRAFADTASFMLGGKGIATALGKTSVKAAGGIASWLGSVVGGQRGREDALRHGAEEWQLSMAYYANSFFGLSEGLPIGVMLGRIDDLTGGVISRRLKSKVGQLAAGGFVGLLTEALQEAGQTWGENWTARDLAMYDPERSLTDNMVHAAGIGGSVGFSISLVTTAMGMKNRARYKARLDKNKARLQELTGLDNIDDLTIAIVSQDPTIIDLMESAFAADQQQIEGGEVDAGITLRAAQERDDAGDAVMHRLPRLRVDRRESSGTPQTVILATDSSENSFRSLIEHVNVNEELEGNKNVIERLYETAVVMALTQESTSRRDTVTMLVARVAELKSELAAGPPDAVSTSDLATAERHLKTERKIIKAEQDMAKDLKSLGEKLRTIIGDSAVLLVNNTTLRADPTVAAETHGRYAALEIGPQALVVHSIELDTGRLSAAIAAHEGTPTDSSQGRITRAKVEILSTFLHEFGHAVGHSRIQNLFKKVLDGQATENEKKLFNNIRNDYLRFLGDNLGVTTRDAMNSLLTLSRAGKWLESGSSGFNASTSITQLPEAVQMYLDTQLLTEKMTGELIDYLFSWREYLAEEFSKVAMKSKHLVDAGVLPFFEESVDLIREALQRSQLGHTTTPTLEAFAESFGLRQTLKTIVKDIEKNTEQNPIKALATGGFFSKEVAEKLVGEADSFNRFMDIGFNILQIAEQNPHLVGLQNYVQHLREWKNEVNNNLKIAEDRLTEWRNLGKKESEQLGRSLLDESVGRLPDGGWLRDPRFFTAEELASYNLSEEALLLRAKIREDLMGSLNQMEEVLVNAKKRIFADDVVQQTREIAKVKKEFKDMREKPYHPLMRFGEYILLVRASGAQTIDGRDYNDGALVDYQAFDTRRERDKTHRLERKRYVKGSVTMAVSKQVMPNFSLQGLPMTLLEHLETKLTAAGLTEEVRDAIKQLKNDALPFKSFRKQFQRRKRVEGYSMDAMRSYANYMTSFSNHIARIKFDHLFKNDFENLDNSIKVINRLDLGDSTKRAGILNHMNEHMQYVMNPVNEFVGIRSAAFFWFLGFNVKSAVVNLTQIGLVTYPYLAARYGDGKAVAQLTRAYGTALKSMTHKGVIGEELEAMIEKGLSESWLDESLATELALAASEKNLDKTLPRKLRQRAWLKISHYGSLPFHLAEKLNRHITAIAAYRLAKTAGKTIEEAQFEARRAVEKTQFEYARWARPKFMRGKVGGTVFVFQNYMQNALYFALGGDPGAMRMLLMLFLVAGLQGLPFGENIMDLYDAGVSAWKKKSGQKDPHTNIRVELRKFLKSIDVDPDLILHGMSSSSFGLANIGEFMGWPIPDLDLSGSLSMGRIIPGTELLAPGQADTFERAASGVITRGGGAIASAGAGVGQAIFNSHPDQWKRWEKAMPAAMRNISKAARYAVRGEEATRSGYPIAGFDMHDIRDQWELVGQSLGFPPRDVTKGWESFIAQQQAIIYYESWKTLLLRQWNYAKENKDEEAVKEINLSIRAYNSMVPFAEMKVGHDTRIQSFESYLRTRKFSERKIEQSEASRRLSSSIEAVFEEADSEGT